MKKKVLLIFLTLCLALSVVMTACGNIANQDNTEKSTESGEKSNETTEKTDNNDETETEVLPDVDPITDESITAEDTTEEFSITTSDGAYTEADGVYTLTAAGTYSLSGALNGQIIVDAPSDATVEIELKGVTITYDKDSPIKVVCADEVEISAKKGTENVIKDLRGAKTEDSDDQGAGAISAKKADLKLKGKGTLVVIGNYNNGVHTTKDLTIKNLSLKVTAYNNAIKGKDSVTVESATIVAISTNGDGIETESTDQNKSGETRGDITLTGGAVVTVYAAGDGFQSAHNFSIYADEEGNAATVTVYTGSYSGYTAKSATTDSYKGIKVKNELNISAGTVILHTYDDGLHADYGTEFEDGTKGVGNINISGGDIQCSVYSPIIKTSNGSSGPRGWSGQQNVTGADAIHADNTLTISGGTINIDSSYEGLEATHIVVTGGQSYVSANDDGVNAAKKINETPSIEITGGYLDVTVSSNGDTDGIDSNGTYTQSGGIVITRGPGANMAAALDTDGKAAITGGTIIVLGALGFRGLTRGSGVTSYNLSLNSKGTHTVKIDGVEYTFKNNYAYSKTICYSSVTVTK